MGRDLAERFAAAREVFAAVDDALGAPLSRIMWEGPEEELTRTHNAQPAILAHSLAVYAVVRGALRPLLAAGHSLGEYTAYVAADALGLRDAARLVRRRGELMLGAGSERPGTMAAVLGLPAETVVRILADVSHEGGEVVAANLNAPDQTVISGDPEAVERAGEALTTAGAKRVLPLKVSGAFHSPLMAPAAAGLAAELAAVPLRDPAFPVVANVDAVPVRAAADARRKLEEQLTSPVRWVESMHCADREVAPDVLFLEIGPGTVLSGLLKRILPARQSRALGTADEVTAFLEECAA